MESENDENLIDEISRLKIEIGLNTPALASWRSILNVLSRDRDHFKDDDSYTGMKAMNGLLQDFLTVTCMSGVWKSILVSFTSSSRARALYECRQLMLGYHIISNFFRGSSELLFSSRDYMKLCISSLVNARLSTHGKVEAFSNIIEALNSDGQFQFLEWLCSHEELACTLIPDLSPDWGLDTANILLRWVEKTKSLQNMHVLKHFIHHALSCYDEQGVIEKLMLRKPVSDILVPALIESFPTTAMMSIVSYCGSLWGERIFVAQGNAKMQQFLTTVLTTIIPQVSREQLLAPDPFNGSPLAVVLSAGVSTYLDSSDTASRLRGMRVARAFSAVLGRELTFTELEEADKQLELERELERKRQLVDISSPSSTEPCVGITPTKTTETSDRLDEEDMNVTTATLPQQLLPSNSVDVPSDGSSDSDSDLEPYDLTEEPVDAVKTTNYLRGCLEMLQYPDTKPEAFEKQRSALVRISAIVATAPIDARDLCAPLVKELLRLTNYFNMERFAELQSQALQALLCAYPSLAAPVIAWALDAESVALGSRLSCIVALEMAAETISGIHSKQGRAAAAVTEGTASVGMNAVSSIAVSDISSPATRSPSLLGDDPAASSQTPGGREQNLAGKTRIKRPKMLAAWRRREEARNSSSSEQTGRNNFGAVAHLFFYPVLQALATALRGTVGTSSKGLSSTSPSLRIGSDTFLTSRGESGTTTQVGGRYIPSILLLPVDGQESGVGGGLTGSDTAHTRTKAGRPKEDQGDSLQSLLPARALLALGTFTRCCINAPVQRTLLMETMKAATLCQDSSALSVRRASLGALFTAVETWSRLKKEACYSAALSGGPCRTLGGAGNALEVLTDISRTNMLSGAGQGDVWGVGRPVTQEEAKIDATVVQVADWAMASIKEDPDVHCRVLKGEILRFAVEGFDPG